MREPFGNRIKAIAASIKRDGLKPVHGGNGRPYLDQVFSRWKRIEEGDGFIRFIPYTKNLSDETAKTDRK